MRILFLILAASAFLASCDSTPPKMNNADEQTYLHKGDSIANIAQNVLLANVANAIAEKGVASAIDFCNEQAILLTDSVSEMYKSQIQRLSDKNRNPDNGIKNGTDSLAWTTLHKILTDTLQRKKHLVMQGNDNHIYYYKAISIGMPTCLKCHGDTETDIAKETLMAISQKYPEDKATGYEMNEFRGMWKIKIK